MGASQHYGHFDCSYISCGNINDQNHHSCYVGFNPAGLHVVCALCSEGYVQNEGWIYGWWYRQLGGDVADIPQLELSAWVHVGVYLAHYSLPS